jgi:hypothetical protein
VVERTTSHPQTGRARWICRCDCGSMINVRSWHLLSGDSRSCGCLNKKLVTARFTKHGGKRRGMPTPEYVAWCNLMALHMAAEQRQVGLQTELIRLNGSQQQAVLQITPAALEQHLQGLREKLRSGVNGKVREVIQRAVRCILIGVDGSLTIEVKPRGLLGLEGTLAQLDGQEGWTFLEHGIVSCAGRQWKVVGTG